MTTKERQYLTHVKRRMAAMGNAMNHEVPQKAKHEGGPAYTAHAAHAAHAAMAMVEHGSRNHGAAHEPWCSAFVNKLFAALRCLNLTKSSWGQSKRSTFCMLVPSSSCPAGALTAPCSRRVVNLLLLTHSWSPGRPPVGSDSLSALICTWMKSLLLLRQPWKTNVMLHIHSNNYMRCCLRSSPISVQTECPST